MGFDRGPEVNFELRRTAGHCRGVASKKLLRGGCFMFRTLYKDEIATILHGGVLVVGPWPCLVDELFWEWYCSTFFIIWQLVSNHSLIRLKRFVS